jgi:uncharacterized membrane protein YgcG
MSTATGSSAKATVIGVIAAAVIALPVAGLIGGTISVPVKYNIFALAQINADQLQQLEQQTNGLADLINQVKDKSRLLSKQNEYVTQQIQLNQQVQNELAQQLDDNNKALGLMSQIIAGETPLVGLTKQVRDMGVGGVSVANATVSQVQRLYNALVGTQSATNVTIDKLNVLIALLQESVHDFHNIGKLKSLVPGGSGSGGSGGGSSGGGSAGGGGSSPAPGGLPALPLP